MSETMEFYRKVILSYSDGHSEYAVNRIPDHVYDQLYLTMANTVECIEEEKAGYGN